MCSWQNAVANTSLIYVSALWSPGKAVWPIEAREQWYCWTIEASWWCSWKLHNVECLLPSTVAILQRSSLIYANHFSISSGASYPWEKGVRLLSSGSAHQVWNLQNGHPHCFQLSVWALNSVLDISASWSQDWMARLWYGIWKIMSPSQSSSRMEFSSGWTLRRCEAFLGSGPRAR
jgi:hypothetical protein